MDLKRYQWIMLANRDGICNETGKQIKAGDKILYIPPIPKLKIAGRVFCETSKAYKESLNSTDTGFKIEI